ncbi:MAG: DUF3168 domain-containing protein [Parvularculaceae bacterium]|nr:DUF3168 domain-containing protein [Parvularculaceae bacterium]
MTDDAGAGWALQSAIVAQLKADAGLKTLIGDPPRVIDGPSRAKIFPFVSIDETRETPLGPAPGHVEHDIRVSVHSRYEGRREAKEITTALVSALNDAPLTVTGRRLVSLRAVYADVIFRSDADAHQGLLRFRAVTEKL